MSNYHSEMYLLHMLNEYAATGCFKDELIKLLRNGNGRDKDARIQELLEANNALVERARDAERINEYLSRLTAELNEAADSAFVETSLPQTQNPNDAPEQVRVTITMPWKLFKKLSHASFIK